REWRHGHRDRRHQARLRTGEAPGQQEDGRDQQRAADGVRDPDGGIALAQEVQRPGQDPVQRHAVGGNVGEQRPQAVQACGLGGADLIHPEAPAAQLVEAEPGGGGEDRSEEGRHCRSKPPSAPGGGGTRSGVLLDHRCERIPAGFGQHGRMADDFRRMSVLRWLELAVGAIMIWIVLRDLFVGVIVPRPARGRVGPSNLVVRASWRAWRWVGNRASDTVVREARLGVFAPLSLILLLLVWVVGLILGYGLVFNALREQLSPVPPDLGTSFYFSGVSFLTIGYGDVVPVGPVARFLALLEGATGLGVVAVVISLLFSLYGSFQRREVLTITLDALAGAPPSGVVLLENSLRNAMLDHLDETLDEWKLWAAEVLESHLAYPVLAYFRSSHDNESWVSAIGAILDASVLIITTVEDIPRGPARLTYGVGSHLVE